MSSPLRRSQRLAGKPAQLFEHPWPRQRRVQFDTEECPVPTGYEGSRAQSVASWFCPAFTALMVIAMVLAGPHVSGGDILRR